MAVAGTAARMLRLAPLIVVLGMTGGCAAVVAGAAAGGGAGYYAAKSSGDDAPAHDHDGGTDARE